ncbi:DUF2955 domain-containing protein [Taklimakanibacter deserti]|uniref:DUF2955 domain-containing protein n=1 Tax=Taklimakanibacter deserti TaxID=2267839 RepID=UPI0034D77C9C
MAFAATMAFAIAELYKWEFSFLAPMLAIQVLAAMPNAPAIRQGVAIPLTIFIATTLALAVSAMFAGKPGVLLIIVGLVIFWTFYGRRSGAPGVVMLLIQIAFCCVPVISTISFDLAQTFSNALLWGSIAALVTVWIAHLVFPAPAHSLPPAAPPVNPADLPPTSAARGALIDMIILMPILVAFIIGGNINNIVILIIVLNLLREVEPVRRSRVALALLVGNVLGGALGVLAYQFVVLANNSLVFFTLVVLAASLWFGGRFARRGDSAPVYAIAFATFLLILGLGVSPLPMGSEEAFAPRILKILLATAYTIGALSLVALRRERAPPARETIR